MGFSLVSVPTSVAAYNAAMSQAPAVSALSGATFLTVWKAGGRVWNFVFTNKAVSSDELAAPIKRSMSLPNLSVEPDSAPKRSNSL